MRLMLLLLLVACGKPAPPPAPDATPLPDAEPPPPPVAVPPQAPVEGASLEQGASLFAKHCESCHGADGRGQTETAAALRFPPTDLSGVAYLCRTTDARPVAVPADDDIETAIDRGAHRELAAVKKLDAAARRSLMLHVKSLARGFASPSSPLYVVPPETPDDAASRARGRTMYLATGCWRCHGVDGTGGEEKNIANMRWNGGKIAKISSLTDPGGFRCGSSPEAIYRVIGLGLVSPSATIMPRYQDFAEVFERPRKGTPAEWTRHLQAVISPEEVQAVQAWLAAQPDKDAVAAMPPSARRARAAGMLWDLVHHVRAR